MQSDRHRLRRRLLALQQATDKIDAQGELEKLSQAVDVSLIRRQTRLQGLPQPEFPESLPISQRRSEIAKAIAQHQVTIIAGETGSGKTTQIPKICLELGRGVDGLIGCTQPRRIAARSVAEQIARELGGELGQAVGYKVRFGDKTSEHGYIKMMTDGILLAEIQSDRYLNGYDTLIIDEAHERSLNIDFLLGYLKQLLPKRPDLKLIITSATIDTERFSSHFDGAPIIEVSGRTYPVEVRYRPLLSDDPEEQDRDQGQAILAAVDELAELDRTGHILVFLSGEREIRETAELLRKHHPPHTEILPLYARLNAAEQARVFQPSNGRRIILATNVAETSLTVPGVRFVVDTGYARISRYSPHSKVQRLPIETVSQSSANQRKGRCGRLSDGVCIRLYSETDFINRPEFTQPEILRTSLADVILRMAALNLGPIDEFPFVEPPLQKNIRDGYQQLIELGAIKSVDNGANRLTKIGRQLAQIPVDVRLGRMILEARRLGVVNEVLIIAAVLGIQDPRERPMDAQQAADQAHQAYQDPKSDFIGYLNLWLSFHKIADELRSQSKLRKYCKSHYLSFVRMREWQEVHRQLVKIAKDLGFSLNQQPGDYELIHQSLLSGLLGQIAFRSENREYTGARQIKLALFPGSSLYKKPPKWIVAGELVETSRLYARVVAVIEPEWVEPLARNLCKYSYLEPHWQRNSGRVMAYEQVSLYGLVLVARRLVDYSKVNSAEAREIFIRSGLVVGEAKIKAPFLAHNQRLVREIEQLEFKQRRRDVLVDEEVIFSFYDRLIPESINSVQGFDKWRKDAETANKRLLYLEKAALMQREEDEVGELQYPDYLIVNGTPYRLKYYFEPGHVRDGVTIQIPLGALNQLSSERLEWLVPGLLKEKITWFFKSLPKSLRKSLVPVPNSVDACLEDLDPEAGSLQGQVFQWLQVRHGLKVTEDLWKTIQWPAHLQMNIQVLDDKGHTLAMERGLGEVKQALGGKTQEYVEQTLSHPLERRGIKQWDFGDLPVQVEIQHKGISYISFPALYTDHDEVGVKLFDSAREANLSHRTGLLRLFRMQSQDKLKYLQKNIRKINELCLMYISIDQCDALKQDIVDCALTQAFFPGDMTEVRSGEEFQRCLVQGREQLVNIANNIAVLCLEILTRYKAVVRRLESFNTAEFARSKDDITRQLRRLVYSGFLVQTPYQWLVQLPRYLQAMERRLEKLGGQPGKDRQYIKETESMREACLERLLPILNEGVQNSELEEFRWALEEYAVSLFAQELKTLFPISLKRLENKWRLIGESIKK